MKKFLLSIFIIYVFAIGHNIYASDLNLISADSGNTFKIEKGQTLKVTLSNPGDGGYVFNDPQYDSSILSMKNHTHINPSYYGVVGNFGQDYWEFQAINTGRTKLTITASRSWMMGDISIIFSSLINVLSSTNINDGCLDREYYNSGTSQLCDTNNIINPTISSVSGPQSLDINQMGTWIIRATDGTQRNLTYSVDWGDTVYAMTSASYRLPQNNQSQSATFSHSYSQAGNYTPTFTVASENSIRCITTPCPSNLGSTKVILSVAIRNSNNINTDCFSGDIYNRLTGQLCSNISPNPIIIQNQRTLRFGLTGTDVGSLQKFLNISVDGIFGRGTDLNLRNWQQSNGLYPDGIFGPKCRQVSGL